MSKLPADLIQLDSHSSTHLPEHCSDKEKFQKYQFVIIRFSMSVVCYTPKGKSPGPREVVPNDIKFCFIYGIH